MTMICKDCENDGFYEAGDGYIYCQRCGARADGAMETAVDDEDFVGIAGDTRGALYQAIHTRRQPTQQFTPSQHRFTEETMRYSQFRSQLQSASQIPKSGIAATVHERGDLFREVKREPENLDTEPTEPADFGAGATSYEDYYEEARDRYVKGFLMMITYQCDALVEKFNVTPLIIGLVGPICLRFVALSGVFDDDWADKAILDSELQTEDTNGEEVREVKRRGRYKDEPKTLYGKRAVTIWVNLLEKTLPLSSSLAISFLACHKAGAPILPTDLVRWAREGKIPYRSCFLKILEQMGERSAACPVAASKMFRPTQIVSAQMLEARAALIADIIGLPLPPVNFYAIASNYLKRLSIPEDNILDLACLIQKWSMPPDLYLSNFELKLPTRVCVMSILILAIRMLYNINGFGVWERSLGLATTTTTAEADVVSEELNDDEDDLETKSTAEGTEFDTEELLKNLEAKYYDVAAETVEYEKDLFSYLSHGKKEMFAGSEEASADDTYITIGNLWKCYSNDEEFKRPGTPSKRVRDWEDQDDLSFDQFSLDDNKFSDRNNPCSTSPSRRTKSGSMDHDQSSFESEHRVSSPENYSEEERSIRRLITDMRENLFCYISPRVKVKRRNYLHYVRKREDGALIYAVHADYYILLRICAQVAEIDVRNMHRGVLSFERRLAWIEKRIDQVLHVTPPSMTCDHCCDGGNVAEDEDEDFVLAQVENLVL